MTGEIDPREDRDVYRLDLVRRTDLLVDVVGGFQWHPRTWCTNRESWFDPIIGDSLFGPLPCDP